ncbi:hypothetical protein BJ684DRAFT_18325 [Piptocephalis cylindrospora]|uniref:CASTOR ACT domain-containing protein n=1 Tax=Piptocephalis cylindrospora TaxID=1907219 RepID=A0A4P9Y930_9FUNG|nr:hypothetical protein BJ684DRAFT_18325 [Piptocephalis cylindrospora]|eukprot:RKP15334.1 hypothetical protein BJ684DRAFT_18325 [Piptocephalis cylindrospora]
MSICILHNRLRMLTLPIQAKPSLNRALVQHILFPAHPDRFFMYTENSTNVALIVEDAYFSEFVGPDAPFSDITSYDEVFRALEVEATDESRNAPLITELAAPLSRAGISIFYISTYQTDLFLVAENRLPDVISSLRAQKFTFDDVSSVPLSPGSEQHFDHQGDADTPPTLPSQITTIQKEVPQPPPSPTDIAEEVRREERRAVRDGDLAMAGLNLEFVELWGSVVVKVLLYPELLPNSESPDRFVSYTATRDGVSIVADSQSLEVFNEDWLNRSLDAQPLRLIQFSLDGFDKDRHGIVHSVTKPLSVEGIPLLYLSTILTANVLVGIHDAPRALKVLDAA